ncbi:hypothetical protein QQ056_05385 [Oscillatoria laete-virens NRMC-F 0139]|nr:hypothetical protein [Oscillatoria laete-virens]MDL5052986.1 hypothetical protein [Oscillatoria laete-virens NRMC-F 0139]
MKQDHICPNCSGALDRTRNRHGFVFVCKPCRGVGIGLGPLKKMVCERTVTALWVKARQSNARQSRPCPTCRKLMDEIVALENSAHPVHVDICLTCHLVWFDQHEFEQFPTAPQAAEDLLLNNQKAREALAMMEVERIANRARRDQMTQKAEFATLPVIASHFLENFIRRDVM